MIRQPIITIMGHVDHGKTSILDKINETAIAKSEAGGITQKISSTIIPLETIKKICGKILTINLKIPGLLFIDTPGHAAFNNLRRRGGNLADIAILVIDINEGLKPQTLESIDILKQYKTPFVIVLNKIDLINGYKKQENKFLLENVESQNESVKKSLDEKLYRIVERLFELGFNADRFDRVSDYTKQVALIPCSAKTGDGIAELLMVISGLAQKYLENSLKTEIKGPGKGTILEVKEDKGLGKTMDVIVFDGSIKKNDHIIIGSFSEPIITKVKALFEPEKSRLKSQNEVHASSGIKISALNLDNVIPGMPLRVISDLEKDKEEIRQEVSEVLVDLDDVGLTIKADSLGSLEALIKLLRENGFKIKKADIGDITKKDISEVSAELDPLNKVIIGFNVKSEIARDIRSITSNIIYTIIDELKKWQDGERKKLEAKELEDVTRPCKIKILRDYIFRKSNPAVVGVEVVAGTIRTGSPLFKEGKQLTEVKGIQLEKENISEAKSGKQVAISLPDVTVGRQINEEDVLYSFITEQEFRKLRKLKKFLNSEEIEVLKEIALINRKTNPLWGV
ncbi:translation initiation factor IF-2 [Candidatus Woesearchaeota archaeon]|nr:translation initiation factor IF-2 [Candidatus Woesearchaeota archaeon]